MDTFAEQLLAGFRSRAPELLALARDVVGATQEMGPERYTDHELQQLLNGFQTLVAEALADAGTENFDLFIETAIPGLVAEGQSMESLAHAAATFGVLVSLQLAEGVAPEHRPVADRWLAGFFGRYVRAVAASARVAEDESRA